MRPSRWMLNCSTTRPWNVIAACGTNQLRRTWPTKRRIHGPNSTPLVSNWIAGPGIVRPALRVVERLVLHVALEVLAARRRARRSPPVRRSPVGRRRPRSASGRRASCFGGSGAGSGAAGLVAARPLGHARFGALGRVAARERQRIRPAARDAPAACARGRGRCSPAEAAASAPACRRAAARRRTAAGSRSCSLLAQHFCRRCSSSSGLGWNSASRRPKRMNRTTRTWSDDRAGRPRGGRWRSRRRARPGTDRRNRNGSTAPPREIITSSLQGLTVAPWTVRAAVRRLYARRAV